MRSPALFDLFARLLREHPTRGVGAPIEIVPVVLVGEQFDDVDEADAPLLELLHAIARYSDGGEFADAGRILTEPTTTADNAVLLGALQAALRLVRPRMDPVQLVVRDGRVEFADTPDEILSPGQREMLGLATALMDTRWSDRQLGILTYSERSMDPAARRACWRTITVGLRTASLRVGGLSTLIVASRAPTLLFDAHCSTEHGARYVLQDNRLTPRGPADVCARFAREAVRAPGAPLVLFLGAGFSRSSTLPLGNDLRDQALRRRYDAVREAPIGPLAIRLFRDAQAAQQLSQRQIDRGEDAFVEQLTLEQVVALETVLLAAPSETLAEFAAEEAAAVPGPSVVSLGEFLDAGRPLVLVTVNFDELIERAVGTAVRPVVTLAEFAAFADYLASYLDGEESAVPLLKLHGTISQRDTCVINAAITEEGLPPEKAEALRALHVEARRRSSTRPAWVYVGASLRDVDVVPVLEESAFGAEFEEAWVMPLRERSIEDFAESRQADWAVQRRPGLDARTVSAAADDFLGAFAAAARI